MTLFNHKKILRKINSSSTEFNENNKQQIVNHIMDQIIT